MDLVLVSDAKNLNLKRVTEMAIASAGNGVNIIVIESNSKIVYPAVTTIHPGIPFSYNAYLNIGAKQGRSDFIFFGNNDLVFIGDWWRNLKDCMNRCNTVSASPLSPLKNGIIDVKINSGDLYGYKLIDRFCGWAFVLRRSFYEKVGGLNEDFKFWCSDNSVIEQLKSFKEKHVLATSSFVQHLGGFTIRTLDSNRLYDYTISEINRFNAKYKKNLWNEPHLKHLKTKFSNDEN